VVDSLSRDVAQPALSLVCPPLIRGAFCLQVSRGTETAFARPFWGGGWWWGGGVLRHGRPPGEMAIYVQLKPDFRVAPTGKFSIAITPARALSLFPLTSPSLRALSSFADLLPPRAQWNLHNWRLRVPVFLLHAFVESAIANGVGRILNVDPLHVEVRTCSASVINLSLIHFSPVFQPHASSPPVPLADAARCFKLVTGSC